MQRILFLCAHNSARSQLAEALMRAHIADGGLNLEVYSAGVDARPLHPQLEDVLGEWGLRLGHAYPKNLDDIPEPWNFDFVITLCEPSAELCPTYPAKTRWLHWPCPELTHAPLDGWRVLRNQLERRIEGLLGGIQEAKIEGGHYLPQFAS